MRLRLVLAALALSATLSGSLRADPNEDAARALFKEGLALHEKANYAAALEKFYSAYARWKNPKILANIGTAAWELGRYVEACNAYDQFLAEAPPNDPSRADVQRAREEVLRKVGTLKVLFDANSGTVAIDGKAVEPPKLAGLRVSPGYHKVELNRANGSRVAHGVDVAMGATVQVDLRQSQPMSIVVATAPPPPPPSLPPPSQPPPRDPQKASPSRGNVPAVPLIIGGVGVAGLVASGVLFNMRSEAVSDLEDDCIADTCPRSSQDDIDSANQLGLFSLIALGVGIAGVGTATYMLTIGRPEEKTEPKGPTTTLGFSATPRGAGGSLRVRF